MYLLTHSTVPGGTEMEGLPYSPTNELVGYYYTVPPGQKIGEDSIIPTNELVGYYQNVPPRQQSTGQAGLK